jgi:hypothetical protein
MVESTRTSRQAAVARGRRIQAIARDMLIQRGALVETAPNVVRRIIDPKTREPKIITLRHDFFNLWDFLCVWPDGERTFVQVTVLEEVPHRRRKIESHVFPCGRQDVLLGYKGGRDRHFRVFRGPTFTVWDGECWRPGPRTGPPVEEGAGGGEPA